MKNTAKKSAPRAVPARVYHGRVEPSESLDALEGSLVMIVPFPAKDASKVRTLESGDPEWAELAALCGWTPEEMEQELNQPWNEGDELRERADLAAYGKERAQALGIRTQRDLDRFLARQKRERYQAEQNSAQPDA